MEKRGCQRVLVPVNNPLGGIRSYLLYNLRSLNESGYAFTFIAPSGNAFEAFKDDVRQWHGVDFVDVPVHNRKSSLRKAIRRALKDNRFALVHSQGLRAGVETSIAMVGMRVPHAITLHDVINLHNPIPGRFKWLRARIVGRITSTVDAIVAVSHDCADNHLRHFPEWKRGRCEVIVIPNGVDVARLNAQMENETSLTSLRQQFGIDEQIAMVGFFGRLMPQKGFLELLEALRELGRNGFANRLRLIAIKDPHGYRGEYMRAVADDKVLSKMVHFIDPVPNIAPVLAQMDMLVMPSLWEACGLLAMEAMILGVPVVGSNAIGLREVLGGSPALTPEAGNSEALAAAIERSFEPSLKRQAEEYAPIARQRFDNRVALGRLRKIYQSFCSRSAESKSQ